MVIQTQEQLDTLLQQTVEKPLFLYKHSTNCGSSRVAYSSLHQFTARFRDVSNHFAIAMIRTLEDKPLSHHIEAQLGVPHKSPQIILVFDNKAIWHASHQQINSTQLYNGAMHYFFIVKKSVGGQG